MKKIRSILTWTFGGMAILWLLFALGIMVWFQSATDDMIRVPGRIVDISGGKPTVSYEVDGVSYDIKGVTSSSTFRTGDEYHVYADPADPSHAVDPGFKTISLIFGGLGVLFFALGAGFYAYLKRKENLLKTLRACGLRSQGRVTKVYQNKSVKFNQRCPWVVEAACEHPRLGTETTARSGWLWETSLQPGDAVDVLFDPMNDQVRMVDTGEATA